MLMFKELSCSLIFEVTMRLQVDFLFCSHDHLVLLTGSVARTPTSVPTPANSDGQFLDATHSSRPMLWPRNAS